MSHRTIGPVTTAAGLGGVSGAMIADALVALLVTAWPTLADVREPLTVLLTAALSLGGALVGGYLVPPQHPATTTEGEDTAPPAPATEHLDPPYMVG
jgi:hypothetical protein